MTERHIFSSFTQFAELAKKHPNLLTVSILSVLRDTVNKANQASGGCKCSRKAGGPNLENYRTNFEAAMSVLSISQTDSQKVKSILSTQKLCYYKKNESGQLKLHCF